MATAKKSTSSKPKAAAKSPAKTQAKQSTAKAKSSTASKPAAKKQEEPQPAPQPLVGNATHERGAHPVVVNNATRRSDEDALEGGFCEVVAGEHKGIFGTFVQVVEREKDGYPKTILVRNRDFHKDVDLITVPYSDVRPAEVGGRRSNVNA